MSSPLVGVVAVNAFLFGVYGYLLDCLQKWTGSPYNGSQQQQQPSLTHVFLAGAGSGIANSLISCPLELAKIQVQNQSAWKGRQFRGPWDCFKYIFKEHGLSGCFRGMTATVLRETPSYGVYFLTFEGTTATISLC